MRKISLKYRGRCVKCGSWIPVGETAYWEEDCANDYSAIPGFPFESIVAGLLLGVALILSKNFRSNRASKLHRA